MLYTKVVSAVEGLTLPNAKAMFIQSTRTLVFFKTSEPCHVGIHWIDLADYSPMSTHVLGFQSFFLCFLHYVVLAKLISSSIRVKLRGR